MDIYEPENEFYGLIGRPNITAVQPYSSSSSSTTHNSSSTTKDIVIHFNNDDGGIEQGEQSSEEIDTKAFIKQEIDSIRTNNENYVRSDFVELNYGKKAEKQSAFQLDQNSSQPGFYQNNNGQQGNVMFSTNMDGNGQSSFNSGNKQYQILQERGSAPQQQNIPNVRYNSSFSQQQTSFNTTTGAYENGLNNAYQNTAITNSNNQNDTNNPRYQFQQPMISQPYNPTHAVNGIYQTSNQDFQGQHIVVKAENDDGQSEEGINNGESIHQTTTHDQTDEIRSNDGDKPLEPELDIEGKGSVVCPICGVTYSKYYYNLKHRFFHSGKKYDCTICGRSFNHQHNMYRHKRVHEDINDYQFRCGEESCEMVFKTQTGLKRHMQMKHSISLTGNTNEVRYAPQNFKEVNPAPTTKKRRRRRKGVEIESVQRNNTPTSAAPNNIINPTNAITNNFQQQQMFTPTSTPTSNTVQMMAGNNPQIAGNPSQMSVNPPQMLSNTTQMPGNQNQMQGNQMTGNSAHMVQMIDQGKPVTQQYFDPNTNQQFTIVQNPAMSLSQNSFNNNNNNKNFKELKSVSTSQAMTTLPIANQNFGNPSQPMMQMIPGQVPMMPQNPTTGYVNMDQTYRQTQSYINNENQNLERMSPYSEFQVPTQSDPSVHHSSDKKTSANNGNKTTAVRCHICDKDFSVHYIREHLDHHAGRRYTCYICGLVFLSRDRLKRHKNQHTNKSEYDPYCVRCKLYFPSEKKLAFHIRKIHDSEQMKCSRILQREGAKLKANSLQADGQTALTESMLQNKDYISEEGITIDLERKIQVGKKIYFKCKYCNGCFKSKRNRNKHELMHEELGGQSNVNDMEVDMIQPNELQSKNITPEMHLQIEPEFQSDNMEQEMPDDDDDDEAIIEEVHMNNMGQGMPISMKQEFESNQMGPGMVDQMKQEFQSIHQPGISNPQVFQMNSMMKQENSGQLTQEFQSIILPQGKASPVKQEFQPNELKQEMQNQSNLDDGFKNSEKVCRINEINEVKSPINQNMHVDQTTNNNNTMKKDTNDGNVDSSEHDTPSEVKANENGQKQGTVKKDMHKCPYCDSVFKKDIVLNRHISMHLKKIQK